LLLVPCLGAPCCLHLQCGRSGVTVDQSVQWHHRHLVYSRRKNIIRRKCAWHVFVCSSSFHLLTVKIFTLACALYIFHNKHDFGPTNMTLSLLHPAYKSWRTRYKISTLYFSNNITLSLLNTYRKLKTPFINTLITFYTHFSCISVGGITLATHEHILPT
jgi:hypothetical protein